LVRYFEGDRYCEKMGGLLGGAEGGAALLLRPDYDSTIDCTDDAENIAPR